MATSNDLDIRASADRIAALFNSHQAEAALALLEEQRQNQPQAVQEALDRYVGTNAGAGIARHAQDAIVPSATSTLQRLQQASSSPPRFPGQTQMDALSAAQQYDVYASIVQVRGNDAAHDALARPNERVVLGLRQENSTLAAMQGRDNSDTLRVDNPTTPGINEAHGGIGVYNDRLVVLWKDADGSRHTQVAEKANTEPTAQYDHHAGNTGHRPRAEGGVEHRTFAPSPGYESIARPRKIEGDDVNGDGIRDVGRLAEGTIEMRMGQHPNPINGSMDNALRPSQAAVAAGQGMVQRDTNADGWFDQADIRGVQDLNDTFKIHRGSYGSTDSAGCQTIHPDEYQPFIDAVQGNPGQTRWQYVLTNTTPGPVREQQRDQAPGRDAAAPAHDGQAPRQPPHPRAHPDAQAPDRHRPGAPADRPALHPLHGQAIDRVGELDARMGRAGDAYSERMSASLAHLAKAHGLERIDHVLLSEQTARAPAGANVFVVQGELGNPAHLRANMATEEAVNTPVEQSLARLQALDGLAAAQAQSQQQERAIAQEEGGRQRGMA